MITVSIKKENNNYQEIKIMGHAMYDDYGKDIVCIAASSIVITSVNAIIMLDENSIKVVKNKNGLTIKVNYECDTTTKLLTNMLDLLEELSKQYSENIKIDKEVRN